MKRAGFTMIELIFVIVILGILAAVAVPKLNATRDDANAASAATEVSSAITEIGAYYVAQGAISTTISDMTNVTFSGTDITTSGEVNYQIGGSDCIDFDATTDGNLTIAFTSDVTGVCAQVQAALGANDVNKTHQFGGSSVSFN